MEPSRKPLCRSRGGCGIQAGATRRLANATYEASPYERQYSVSLHAFTCIQVPQNAAVVVYEIVGGPLASSNDCQFASMMTFQFFKSSGTLPPFSASFCKTSLCSHMFIDAESSLLPV